MPVDQLLARRFEMAEAVRWDDMPEGIFRDWVIDHYDMCGVIASHIDTPPDDWMRDGWQAVMRWPVVSVKFVGRKPYGTMFEFAWWGWTYSDTDFSEIPLVLLRYLTGAARIDCDIHEKDYSYAEYETEQEAYDDLSRAAVRWACDKAAQECGEMMVC